MDLIKNIQGFVITEKYFQKIGSALSGRLQALLPGHLPVVYKLALLITGLIVLCSGALSGILVYGQVRIMEEQINDFGNTVVSHLAQSIQEPLLAEDRLAMGVLVSSLNAGQNVIGTEILSPAGKVLIGAGFSPFASEDSSLGITPAEMIGRAKQRSRWPWQLQAPDRARIKVVSFISPISFENVTAGYALVTFSRKNLDRLMVKTIFSIAVATGMIIFMGIVMAYVLSKRISRPVNLFMEAIAAFDRGDYCYRFNERRRDEIGQLMAAFDQMAEGMTRKAQVEKALDRYLSPQIARQVMTDLDSVKLGGKLVRGSVLFADMVGYTGMSENMNPKELAATLNRFFSLITWAGELNKGTVDKYMGDCVMLVFGTPEKDSEHAFHAARCGLLISRLVDHENRQRVAEGLFPIEFRIGINAGSMLAGNMGSKEKMEYTVVGDTVNLASRLCTMAEANQIVVSREFHSQEKISRRLVAEKHNSMRLRGFECRVETFLLKDLVDEDQAGIEEQFKIISGAAGG
ncbi:MAG: adenylate/guanylate cyclase domain-containing protein [Desulfurivibrionaceae bacterium]